MRTEHDLTDTDVYKMAISPFGYKAKDCCVITDTVVRKRASSPFGHSDQIKHCHITDTVIRKRSTSTFGNRAQDVVEQFKCSQKTAKI